MEDKGEYTGNISMSAYLYRDAVAIYYAWPERLFYSYFY